MQQMPQESPLSNKELAQCADAQVWAKEFMKALYKNPGIVIDEEVMTGWFANAIMAGWDEANRRNRAREIDKSSGLFGRLTNYWGKS